MKKGLDIYLQDIIESNELIQRRMQNVTLEAFEANIDLQDMVIHRLEIIGEAVKNIPDDFRKIYPEISWHKAAGMRDKLIHGYDSIDLIVVWDTVTVGLPPFIEQIR